jgi:hypothetical protein
MQSIEDQPPQGVALICRAYPFKGATPSFKGGDMQSIVLEDWGYLKVPPQGKKGKRVAKGFMAEP